MADKATSALTPAAALSGAELVAVTQGGNSRRTTAQAIANLGGAGWVLAGSWTHSVDVANVDFTDLGAYTDLMIICRLLTASSSGLRTVLVSTNNGSSFYSSAGDYISVDSSAVESNGSAIITHGTITTSARTIGGIIFGNVANAPKMALSLSDQQRLFVADIVNPINALRVANQSGNLTGGSIYVFGR